MNSEISIIIPTHNRRKYLEEAINSIRNMKEVASEIIVINDRSTDDTQEYLDILNEELPIKRINNAESAFAHGARKQGLDLVSTKYLVFMDDDDYYVDSMFFREAVDIMNSNLEISCVFGSTSNVIEQQVQTPIDLGGSGEIEQRKYINGFGDIYRKPASTLSAVFRVESLRNTGLFESQMVNDTCIYLYGILGGHVAVINRPVAAYRIHNTNISGTTFKKQFITDCLNEKEVIFQKAKSKQLLDNPSEWEVKHLCTSLLYFINSSKNKLKTSFQILQWIISKRITILPRMLVWILTNKR